MAEISAWISSSPVRRYAAAFAVMLLALGMRRAVNAVAGGDVPYITLLPAVAFAAWFCGVGPSLLTIFLGLAGTKYWFIASFHSFAVYDNREWLGILEFLAAAGVIAVVGEVSHRGHESLRIAQGQLEERVQQRTAELDDANQSLGQLTARLLHLQDEERRRIARELHDSVGQTIAALSMNLSAVQDDIARLNKTASAVAESATLVNDLSTGIRTISYLLHPPLLDEAGLSSALRWYIEGFAERSKIKVELEFPNDFARLPRDLETAIFRVVQECLTNIHRHSESPVAKIRIKQSAGRVCIEIEDQGRGIPAEKWAEIVSRGTPGVGIRGMRERLRQLGGSLEIHSDGPGKGTKVVAELAAAPVPAMPSAKPATIGLVH
jgi:signal transduction histidine kinase